MGEWFQTIVDRDATESEAPVLGAAIQQWLVDEGIVSANATDCVLGSDRGFPPGSNYQKATGDSDDNLLCLATNGLEVITERTLYFSLGSGGLELVCSACSGRFELPDEWGDAVNEWYENKGPGLLACPQCGERRPITQWEHDPPCGFANLGFNFWNWPQLADDFVKEIGDRLGHRLVLVSGKL